MSRPTSLAVSASSSSDGGRLFVDRSLEPPKT